MKPLHEWINLFRRGGDGAAIPAPAPAKPGRSPSPSPAQPPAPERPVPKREPSRPGPSPSEPEPEKPAKPGRPSPRPGREPTPVTDPKNYLTLLPSEYFHTLSAEFRSALSGAHPFPEARDLTRLEQSIREEREDTSSRLRLLPERLDPQALPHRIEQIQVGHRERIREVIHSYLNEIFGDLYPSVSGNLDLQWKNVYDLSGEGDAPLRKSAALERPRHMPDLSPDDLRYLRETMVRSETYYLMIQGFGILYMDGFFRMMERDLRELNATLPGLYEQFHLNGHSTHHRVFEDVMNGKRLPEGVDQRMEESQSQGRVWHSTRPVIDPESKNVRGMESVAHARSEIGVVLVHEALKGSFQLLTPWARLHENYLDAERELPVLRLALNSYWAENRQFAIGPSFFRMFQMRIEEIGIPSHVSKPELFLAIQNLSLLPFDVMDSFLDGMLAKRPMDRMEVANWKRLLLAPPDEPIDL